MKTKIEHGGIDPGEIIIRPKTYYGELTLKGSENKYPEYTGQTTVTPEVDMMQILQTEKKVVKENIIVLPIPYYETSNPQGGNTVYIGE